MENPKNRFLNWCTSFSGCDDGGDIGSPKNPSTWVCGIEPGGSVDYNDDGFTPLFFQKHYPNPATGSEECKILNTRFGRQSAKLLGVIEGYRVTEYKKFAENRQPYTKGKLGYFKWNLYPLPFKNIHPENWNSNLATATGFPTKESYMKWVQENRFPFIQSQKLKYKPKLIICFGKSYQNDFRSAFLQKESILETELIEEKTIYYNNESTTLVAILPFPSGRYGLNRNSDIEKFGIRIRELLSEKSIKNNRTTKNNSN